MNINQAAISFLSHRHRTEEELRRYLEKKGFKSDNIDELINNFKSLKYLDDKNYVVEYCRYSLGKQKSLWRIDVELGNLGVSWEDRRKGFRLYEDEYDVDIKVEEYKNAENAARKVMLHEMEWNKKVENKIGRRLQSLGYDSGTIFEIIDGYRRERLKEDE